MTDARYERIAAAALDELSRRFLGAERCFAGSSEGEAVAGYDENFDIVCLLRLDGATLDGLEAAIAKGLIWEYICENGRV